MGCCGSKDKNGEEENQEMSGRDSKNDKDRKKATEDVDPNFRPIKMLIYRDGDEYDVGTIIAVTRRQFRNWLALLEHLSKRINLREGAVHTLWTLDGKEIRHFKDIEGGEKYIASHKNRIRKVKYGQRPNPKWSQDPNIRGNDPGALESRESKLLYLDKRDYKQTLEDVWDDSGFDLRRKGEGRRNEKEKRETRRSRSDSRD